VDGYRARLPPEILDDLYLAFEDDNKVVGAIAFPEEWLPGLRLANFLVAIKERDSVVS
jgi:hypothetical protein